MSFAHDSRHLAETYDRVSDTQFEGGQQLIERLTLGDGMRVLDIGCGTGRLARWIAERVGPHGSVVGIDPLQERVEIARSRGGARFQVGRAEDLSAFEDASFDAVCMSSVLHWVFDKAKALAEVHRVLRPGGRLGVTTLPHELTGASTVLLVLRPLLERAPYAGQVDAPVAPLVERGHTMTDLLSLLLENNLELSELHLTQRIRVHPTGKDVVDFLEASSFGNFFHVVPGDLRPSLREDLISAFDAQRGPDGIAIRDWLVLFVAMRNKTSC
jgi:ubiquinone/menaquinone biosynthesis C-methylase UbiE